MHLGSPARESALHDAVRVATKGREAVPALIALLHEEGAFDRQFVQTAAKRLSIYTKAERISDPAGRVVVIIPGVSESEEDIENRAKKARKLGATFVVIAVPHLIRLDKQPEYIHEVDAVFYALPWVGSAESATRLPKCFPLRALPCLPVN